MNDEQREQRIKELGDELCRCSSKQSYIPIWREYVELIKGRSVAQVNKMEIERGLV